MPTYVYECERCHHRFELLQGIAEPPRQRCPRCRGKVRRLLTAGGGLIFRGSGFYETDYKRKGERPPSEAGSGHEPKNGEGTVAERPEPKGDRPAGESSRRRRGKA